MHNIRDPFEDKPLENIQKKNNELDLVRGLDGYYNHLKEEVERRVISLFSQLSTIFGEKRVQHSGEIIPFSEPITPEDPSRKPYKAA